MFKFIEEVSETESWDVTCEKGCIHGGCIDLFSCAHCELEPELVIEPHKD